LRRRTLIIVAVIATVSLIVAVYAVTQLFTQNTPTIPVRSPGAGVAASNCSNLAGPTYLTYTTSQQSYNLNFTCAGGYAFTVTVSGVLFPTFNLPYGGPNSYAYSGLNILNSSLAFGNNCGGISSYSISSGRSIALSVGSYYYCAGLTLYPYSPNSASSIPSFSITWSS
jgi:hypothetical protein